MKPSEDVAEDAADPGCRARTRDMHRADANRKGRLVNEDADAIAADFGQSAQILGAKKVVAHPFGTSTTQQRGSAPDRRGTGPHDRAGLRPHRHRQLCCPSLGSTTPKPSMM